MAVSALIANTVEPLGGPNLGLSVEQGDSWAAAVSKINLQFTELYNRTGGTATLSNNLPNPLVNFRNMLDGGDFTVNPWQRGTTFNSCGATLTYTADRWFIIAASTSSGLVTKQANSAVAGFTQALQFGRIATASAQAAITVGQVVETLDSIRAQGQTVNFSFYAAANSGINTTSSPLTVAIPVGFGTDQSASAMVNGTWTSQITNSAQYTLTSTMTRYSFSAAIATSATQIGVSLAYTPSNTSALAGENITIHGAQLEVGNLSVFEHRDVEVELALCQRYFFQVNEGTSASVVAAGMINGTNSALFVMQLPVQMRTAPTVSVVSNGSFAALIVGTATTITSLAAGTTHTPNYISVTGLVTAVSGQASMLVSRQPNSGVITVTADL